MTTVSLPFRGLFDRFREFIALIAVLIGIWLFASLVIVHLEHGYHNASINSYGDAFYWSITTLTTTGYGDLSPVSPLGRFFSGVLMIEGLIVTGAITAVFFSLWVGRTAGSNRIDLERRGRQTPSPATSPVQGNGDSSKDAGAADVERYLE